MNGKRPCFKACGKSYLTTAHTKGSTPIDMQRCQIASSLTTIMLKDACATYCSDIFAGKMKPQETRYPIIMTDRD